ncbi:MAG: hypothetical protein DRQ98_13955 [Gammaproteobacteria bacterium]|nr:MAG: hypothetical protein DRQ98_13955 [Gammaproteobacteria bacterium]
MKPSRQTLLTAVILALAVSVSAQESDPPKTKSYRIFGQLTTLFERNQTGPEPNQPNRLVYSKLNQLASFNIEWKRITIGAQAEYLYWSVPEENRDRLDFDRLRKGFELRRYFLDYQSDLFSGRLGTYFASFGRGMTLYVQKNDALQFDEPIHGATARINLKHFDISALWGKVTEPVQQAQFGREFEDEVMGGRIRAKLPLNLYLGGSAVRAELERPFPVMVGDRLVTNDSVEVWAAEAGGTSLWGVLDLAGEFSEIKKTEPNRVKEGHGRYLSAAAYVGPLSILAEYKDYYNFAYRYNLPPNAGRANEAYEHNDVKGPRLLVSADFWNIGSLFHASYAEFDTHKAATSPGGTAGDHQREWYAGIEQTIGRVYFLGSYFDRDFTDRGLDEIHVLADFHVTVGKRGEIILGYDQRLEESDYARFEVTRSFLAYSISPWGTASVRYSYEDRSGFDKDEFWGIEIQYLPKPTLIVTVFAGGDPGGLVCAGGQCRQEPRFEGYRANFTWRF